MPSSRRSILTAAGVAGLASLTPGLAARAEEPAVPDTTIADLIARSETGNAALLRGDVDTYFAHIAISDDFTLMTPFGGKPTRGASLTPEKWQEIGRFFKNGTLKQEVIQTYGSADLVVLVVIEHCHGEVGGLPAQDWPLRVTLVWQREGSEWRLAHRHADPLYRGISLEQSAALARG